MRLDPGRLDLEDALAGGAALGRAVKTIKEQLRAVPGKGLGYGLLRYLNEATAAELSGLPAPQLGFNYLGRFAAGGEGADWAPATDAGEADDCAARRRRCGDAACASDRDQRADPGWRGRPEAVGALDLGPGALEEAAVRDLAETWFRALTALVRHSEQPGAGGHTPSDLALVDLTQGEIERLESALRPHRGHPAAVAAAGGIAVPCAVRCAGTGRLYGAARA